MSLKNYLSLFECVIMAIFLFKVFSSINERNGIIQTRGISFDVKYNLIKKLQIIRDKCLKILIEVTL